MPSCLATRSHNVVKSSSADTRHSTSHHLCCHIRLVGRYGPALGRELAGDKACSRVDISLMACVNSLWERRALPVWIRVVAGAAWPPTIGRLADSRNHGIPPDDDVYGAWYDRHDAYRYQSRSTVGLYNPAMGRPGILAGVATDTDTHADSSIGGRAVGHNADLFPAGNGLEHSGHHHGKCLPADRGGCLGRNDLPYPSPPMAHISPGSRTMADDAGGHSTGCIRLDDRRCSGFDDIGLAYLRDVALHRAGGNVRMLCHLRRTGAQTIRFRHVQFYVRRTIGGSSIVLVFSGKPPDRAVCNRSGTCSSGRHPRRSERKVTPHTFDCPRKAMQAGKDIFGFRLSSLRGLLRAH